MTLEDKDFQKISDLVDEIVTRRIDERISPLEDKVSHLPTKDEYYESQDELIAEIRNYRDEVDVTTARTVENKDRIEVIEEKLNLSS